MRKTMILSVIFVVAMGAVLSAQPISEQQVELTLTEEIVETTGAEGLLYMAEEEKLARDVYLALYDMWGSRVFLNIANAEQQHMDAVSAIMNDKEITNPVENSEIGVFHNTEIAELYESLVAQGSTSIEEAFLVGAIIEDLDIYDLQRYIEASEDEVEIWVYNNLLRGSESHMRAFVRQLDRYGLDYTARYISDAELSRILSRR
ncbi:DUF2202 domain-containing protein [Sphaerochaeta sp. S2]|uniref:DUF2202 domain-containing protein n=1 Tax=Sphaerochaeta sp. S2 TaxID=2798868 RepID=UPI0018E9F414|nr:DUF2202 domain-containing protein [Sphaerochaeta sp. S2]MBJ2354855.1 DUF2202 domain-containing protein [Sphaerochaeta sp. S2]